MSNDVHKVARLERALAMLETRVDQLERARERAEAPVKAMGAAETSDPDDTYIVTGRPTCKSCHLSLTSVCWDHRPDDPYGNKEKP